MINTEINLPDPESLFQSLSVRLPDLLCIKEHVCVSICQGWCPPRSPDQIVCLQVMGTARFFFWSDLPAADSLQTQVKIPYHCLTL